jgi:hypothetical protein
VIDGDEAAAESAASRDKGRRTGERERVGPPGAGHEDKPPTAAAGVTVKVGRTPRAGRTAEVGVQGAADRSPDGRDRGGKRWQRRQLAFTPEA